MVMAMSTIAADSDLTVIAAYEDGVVMVATLTEQNSWTTIYTAKSHSQPILSLDVAPDLQYFVTSSADAVIAKHPLATSGHQGTAVRAAVNKSIKSVSTTSGRSPSGNTNVSLLSAGLQAQKPELHTASIPPKQLLQSPIKTVNTKHSGQQSVRIRSDGKIIATAGWDGRVRVYSAKTLKEVAVLRWHQTGCYAVALSTVHAEGADRDGIVSEGISDEKRPEEAPSASEVHLRSAQLSQATVRSQRLASAQSTNWLAAGSKDGKISLWDIF
jgi:ASTRA-associated protein 1